MGEVDAVTHVPPPSAPLGEASTSLERRGLHGVDCCLLHLPPCQPPRCVQQRVTRGSRLTFTCDLLPSLQSAILDHAPISGCANGVKMYELQRKIVAVVSCTLVPRHTYVCLCVCMCVHTHNSGN